MESGIALAAVVVRKRREWSRRFGIQRTSVIVTVATATVFCPKKNLLLLKIVKYCDNRLQ